MSSKKLSKMIVVTVAVASSAAIIVACTPAESPGNGQGTGGAKGTGGSATGGSSSTGGSNGSFGTGGSTTPAGTGGSVSQTGGSSGTTSTGGSSSGSGGSGGSTGSTGTGGGSSAGTGGTTVVQKICATKITPMNPVLVNFEDYNGMVTADKYGAAFGGAKAGTGTAYVGPLSWGDGSATPTLSILAGHPPGSWGLSQTVTQASKWGMGGGFWMTCANASAYKGISFWVRGSVPDGKFTFSMNMESTVMPDAANAAGGGTCSGTSDTCKPASKSNIPITMDWTQVQILWTDFTPGMSGTTMVTPNGDNISGLTWSVNVPFVPDPAAGDAAMPPYIAMPSDLVFNIDDVEFIP